MPPLVSIEDLNQARRRSGRLGGRPKKPTVAEARAVKLEELVPRALRVLEENLGAEDERVRQRAAEHVLDRAWGRPTQPTRQEHGLEATDEETRVLRAALVASLRAKQGVAAQSNGEAEDSASGA